MQATGDEARIWHHLFKALARVGNDFCLDVDKNKVIRGRCLASQKACAMIMYQMGIRLLALHC